MSFGDYPIRPHLISIGLFLCLSVIGSFGTAIAEIRLEPPLSGSQDGGPSPQLKNSTLVLLASANADSLFSAAQNSWREYLKTGAYNELEKSSDHLNRFLRSTNSHHRLFIPALKLLKEVDSQRKKAQINPAPATSKEPVSKPHSSIKAEKHHPATQATEKSDDKLEYGLPAQTGSGAPLGNPYWKEYEKQHKQYASLPRYLLPNPAAIINEIHEEPLSRTNTPVSQEPNPAPVKNDIPEPLALTGSRVQPPDPVEAVEKSDRNPPTAPSKAVTPEAKETSETNSSEKERVRDEKPQPVHSKTEENGPDFKNILLMRKQVAESHRTQIQEMKLNRKFVIVLDPGHGGKDPGAISRDGTLEEKSVTLDLALRAKKLLSVNPNIEVLMTREEDKFMSLDDRAAIANSGDADLFISIHCNSHRDASSRGIETYYLDTAGSNREMKTAAQENGLSIKKMSDLQVTLLKLMVASKKKESAQLAASVQDALEASMSLSKRRGVRQAPFCVLMGCKMPAVLVECAFLSNKRESLKLKDPDHLDKIAEGMVSGAVNYMKGLSETKNTGD